MLGLEVEASDFAPTPYNHVVVVKVLSTTPHPNADHLTLAKVSDGKQAYDIVCGAPNCRAGIKTALAKVGATLTDHDGTTFPIKKSKIRGFSSEGMLCAHDELHLPERPYGVSDGILEFPDSFKEGTDLREIFADTLLEVALTPNLSHASYLLGIARELAASFDIDLIPQKSSIQEEGAKRIDQFITVEVKDEKLCPKYLCRLLTHVKVGPSPDWIADRLIACGLRSINNVVDITNYVLLEYGQPLHAFDFDTLEEKKIIVRKAKEGETIVTLDAKERTLSPETLVIADGKKPVAIAGVMGGQDTEVRDHTTTVLLEGALFEGVSVRLSSKRLILPTEAARHFERGIDPNGIMRALDRAVELIVETTGGKCVPGVIEEGTARFLPKKISCRVKQVNQLLGIQLAQGEIEVIFKRLGFTIESSKDKILVVIVPTFRVDISQEIDLIEEVARFYGFENLCPKEGILYREGTLRDSPLYLFESKVRNLLLQEGLQELLTSNLVSPKLAALMEPDFMPKHSLIALLNPTSIDQSIMRPSLLPSLLQVVKWNADHGTHALLGFELGKVHVKLKEAFIEPTVVSLILTGKRNPFYFDPKPKNVDFYDLKGIVENLLEGLLIEKVTFLPTNTSNFHPGRQSEILIDGHRVGQLGEVHPNTTGGLALKEPIYFAELNIEDLMGASKRSKKMKPLPHFPASTRDWTVTLRSSCPYDLMIRLIDEVPSCLLEQVSLLDVYHSEKLGSQWKNITFRFVYRDQEKTVSFKAVENEHKKITDKVTKGLKDQLQHG